jgi:hypothetical protein
MSQSLALSPTPQLPNLSPLTPSDGGGDGLSTQSDAFANTLAAAQNSLLASDGDNLNDGSDINGPDSVGDAILDKLSSLSAADSAQTSSLMTPLEHIGVPNLAADGTDASTNVIATGDQVGNTVAAASPGGDLEKLVKTSFGFAQQTLSKQLQITAIGNISTTVSKLVSQQ